MAEKQKILVVDDDQKVLYVLSEGLEAGGYKVRTAQNGAQGVIAAVQFRPDLILLDLAMPKLDGWQTLERLRRYNEISKIPVIMLTGKGETGNLMRAQELGVTDYFIKPIEIADILKFIRRYIGKN